MFFILKPDENLSILPVRIAPECVIFLDGRQPICVICLFWNNSSSEVYESFQSGLRMKSIRIIVYIISKKVDITTVNANKFDIFS